MNAEAFWVSIFSTPYPRSNVLSANKEKAVGQLSCLGSPLRRTVETFKAWVSSFLALDCEEMTLASSFHSICCWTVFPSVCVCVCPPLANDFNVCILNGQVLMPSAPLQLWVLRLLHRQPFLFLLPHTPCLVFLSLGLVLICSSWFETWNKPVVVQQWDKRQAGEGVGSVLVIGFTFGCHNLLYFLLIFCYSFANLSDGPNVLT